MSITEEHRFIVQQAGWIGFSVGIFIILSFLLPVYLSLPLTVLILGGVGLAVIGLGNRANGLWSWILGVFGRKNGRESPFCCISCGRKHSLAACPDCGSRIKGCAFES